jgi:AraC-like DNA-binding protein
MEAPALQIISFHLEKDIQYIECGIMTTNEPWQHLPRIFGLWVIALCTCGTMYMSIENTEYVIRPGDVFILPIKKLHFGPHMSPGAISYYWAHFSGPDMEDVLTDEQSDLSLIAQDHSYLAYHVSLLDVNTVSMLFNQLYDNNYTQHYTPNIQRELFKVLLYEISNQTLLRRARKFDQHFMQLLDYLRSNFTKPLPLTELAEKFEYNKQYLCRLFKMRTGKTIVAYQTELRLCYACQLLNETNHPVKGVALESGFESEKYFMRNFKQHMHVTPTQFRNSRRIAILDFKENL